MATISLSSAFEVGDKVSSVLNEDKIGQVESFYITGVSPRIVRYGVSWLGDKGEFSTHFHDAHQLAPVSN